MEREKIAHQPGAHRFVLSLPQGEARLEYSLQSQWVNITHTWVPNELRGKGVADALMQAMTTLRPQRVGVLLRHCRSIKAKRLFLALAERHPIAFELCGVTQLGYDDKSAAKIGRAHV